MRWIDGCQLGEGVKQRLRNEEPTPNANREGDVEFDSYNRFDDLQSQILELKETMDTRFEEMRLDSDHQRAEMRTKFEDIKQR